MSAANDTDSAPGDSHSIVLADDHDLYRRGLAQAIEAWPGLELIAEVADGEAALATILEHEPDVAVIDLRMPKLDGIELCLRLEGHGRPIRTRVLLISATDDQGLGRRAIAAGAAGHLSKDLSRDEICEAILRAARA